MEHMDNCTMRIYKVILFASLATLACLRSSAQESHDKAWTRLNLVKAQWMESSNAGALAFEAPSDFNTLDAGYAHSGGDFRQLQTGTSEGKLHFDTQGARQIGKVSVWGRFTYNNASESGASFNTLLNDPYDERFLYSAADSVAGQWKKQSYLMQFKAAMPLGEKVGAGVHVKYTDKIAAGQIDPRAEAYHYCVSVRPAVVWNSGIGSLGLSALYSNTFERSTPSISNSQEIQKLFLMRGLGNWVGSQVGGSGLSTMYFRCNSWGAALQYALRREWKLLAELSYTADRSVITESATQPKPHGNTLRHSISAYSSIQFGSSVLHSLKLSADAVNTTGTEPTALWNKDSGRWETAHTIDQVSLNTLRAALDWDAFVSDDDSYTWHFLAGLSFVSKDDSYALPYSYFKYNNMSAKAGAERRFAFAGGASLISSATISATKNISGGYSYSGHRSGTSPVELLYPHNLSILSADRCEVSADAEYSFPAAAGVNLALCAQSRWLGASCSTDPGPVFRQRWMALGAIKLYF